MVSISWFGVIFIGVIVVMIGLGSLKLLSLLVNAIVRQEKSPQPAKVGSRSQLLTVLMVTAIVSAGLMVVAILHIDAEPSPIPGVLARSNQGVEPTPIQVEIDQTEVMNSVVASFNTESKTADVVDTSATTNMNDRPAEEESSDSDNAALPEARKTQLQQLVSSIGQFVRSNLEMVGDEQSATAFGQTAKSDNGDVVVFQPSDEMVQQILGTGGQDLLKSFNSELPMRIRQTYALIPLTPPVGTTVPVKPFLAAGGLETLANSIVSIMERAESAVPAAAESVTLTAEDSGVLTAAPEIRPIPDWVNKTDGRRIVVHTRPILPGDDADIQLTVAVNEALGKHVETLTATMNNDLYAQAKFVRMELPKATAQKFVLETYERLETMETETEGPKPFRVLYALLEFPEAVDQMAVRQIRQSIQQDRIMGLGFVVGLTWLSVCSAGFGIRQWRKGTVLRRMTAVPAFTIISIPALLIAVSLVLALANGTMPHSPWNSQPITVDFSNM